MIRDEEPIELSVIKSVTMDKEEWWQEMAFECYRGGSDDDVTVYFKAYDHNTGNPDYYLKEHYVKCNVYTAIIGYQGAFSCTHNTYGPALVRNNGKVEFWIDGKQYMLVDWLEICKLTEKEKALAKLKYDGKQDETWLAIDKQFEEEKIRAREKILKENEEKRKLAELKTMWKDK